MREVEVKILDIDVKDVQSKLEAMGARLVFDGQVLSSFFDFPDRSIRDTGRLVRLRKMGDRVYMTVKQDLKKDTVKSSDEHEVEVGDFKSARKILHALGLQERLVVEKHRRSYKIGAVRFEIDTHLKQHGDIPTFLEIEAGESETVFKYAEKLGFIREDCKPWTLFDILEDKSN